MTEYAGNNQEQNMYSLGKLFLGFLFGAGAIYGIWFLSGLVQVLVKMMG
jgi:hypothetical protein